VKDVAIVGAGVIGLAVARELGRAGIKDVVLLEREASSGRGSTARANGGVRAQWRTRPNIAFSRFTIGELEMLDHDTGGLPGFKQAGYLLFTGTEAGEQSLRQGWELQRACGVDVLWLSPEEVMRRAPFLRSDGLRAGTFCGTDGFIDPHGVVQALQGQVRKMGIEGRFETEVTAITKTQAGFSLRTTSGEVEARWLVNAAGPDAARVGALLGVDLPCRPVRRNLACTDPVAAYDAAIPPLIPMCVDLDTGVLIRRESGGFLIAWSNPHDPPGTDTSVDPAFLPAVAERIGNRFPASPSLRGLGSTAGTAGRGSTPRPPITTRSSAPWTGCRVSCSASASAATGSCIPSPPAGPLRS
jgi:sarcosine oxidase subunit beta